MSNEPQRIAKLLARAGIASRREIERMIEEGRIAIDGKPVEKPATLHSVHGDAHVIRRNRQLHRRPAGGEVRRHLDGGGVGSPIQLS